jgi:Crp-like helix-turn-helix domain
MHMLLSRSALIWRSIYSGQWRNHLARVTAVSQPITLPTRRQDIADFLGLKLGTVSRTLAKLEEKNAIRVVPNGVLLTGFRANGAGDRERLVMGSLTFVRLQPLAPAAKYVHVAHRTALR